MLWSFLPASDQMMIREAVITGDTELCFDGCFFGQFDCELFPAILSPFIYIWYLLGLTAMISPVNFWLSHLCQSPYYCEPGSWNWVVVTLDDVGTTFTLPWPFQLMFLLLCKPCNLMYKQLSCLHVGCRAWHCNFSYVLTCLWLYFGNFPCSLCNLNVLCINV